jgi:mRNA-degrading endonuclease toxin of MazEF toxin-antitoxin module
MADLNPVQGSEQQGIRPEVVTFQIRAGSQSRLAGKTGNITKAQLQRIQEGLEEILKY